MRMITMGAALWLALTVCGAAAQTDGPGPDPEGPVFVEGINLGTYWYGKPIDKKDLIGKVVLLEIWGS